uniref:VWFC domain-containing protein n=1 Tax=Anopheles epiroticus TaxID=199890 RepID=A0A182PVA9_9DIPT
MSSTENLDTRCQNVQCATECPSDSYLDTGYQYDELHRERRAIAMNNHAHRPIRITPSKMQELLYTNNVQLSRHFRHLQKRDTANLAELVEASRPSDYSLHEELQELCCPRCVCLPCPEQPACTPNAEQLVDMHEVTLGRPGTCCPIVPCPIVRMCFSKPLQKHFPNNATWNEPSCVSCQCKDGRRHCVSPTCKPLNCEHQKEVPGACCPVCDPDRSIFCEEHNCAIQCQHGYERRQNGCALCKCLRMPAIATGQPSTARTIAVFPTNFTFPAAEDGEANATQEGPTGKATDGDSGGYVDDLTKVLLGVIVVVFLVLLLTFIFWLVPIERVGKWLKVLFRCNKLSQRKSAYNRVSSTVPPPVTPTAPIAQGSNSVV